MMEKIQDKRQIKNTDKTQIKYKAEKQRKTQQNKTTLIWLPPMTLSQETRWAYSTMLPSPYGTSTA